MIVIGYLIFCFLVAFFGRNRQIGFILTLILSLFITPLIMALILLLTAERKRKPARA